MKQQNMLHFICRKGKGVGITLLRAKPANASPGTRPPLLCGRRWRHRGEGTEDATSRQLSTDSVIAVDGAGSVSWMGLGMAFEM